MPVERSVVKDIVDRFGQMKDTAESAGVRAADMKVWAGEAKKQLEKAKDEELVRALSKALESVSTDKDGLLKEAKAIEAHCKALEKSLAELKKAM